MQHLENDTDELFRRAAEHYPLDTNSADWDKVKAMLEQDDTRVNRTRNRRFLWLLLLLPLGFVCNEYVFDGAAYLGLKESSSQGQENAAAMNREQGTQETSSSIEKTSGTTSSANNTAATGDAQDVATAGVPATGATNNTIDAGAGQGVSHTDDNRPAGGGRATTSGNAGARADQQLAGAPGARITRHDNRNRSIQLDKRDDTYAAQPSAQPQVVQVPEVQPLLLRQSSEVPLYGFDRTFRHTSMIADGNRRIFNTATPQAPARNNRYRRFYVGVLGSVDATSIRGQKFAEAGHAYGALIGYDITRRWSVETGFIVDRKYYYTKGEYFNAAKFNLPYYYTVNYVNGFCDMYEVPLSAKYTISYNRKQAWFATAGVSSYFMTREDYEYNVTNSINGASYPYKKSYGTNSNAFFAVAQVTGGYTRSLGRIADVRIEPYLKLPLRKVGTGDMPLVSTGLQLSFTKRLF